MPGIPLVARETTYSRSGEQMCRQDSRAPLSVEEEMAAEESLSIYCKPVELYNILQSRAVNSPSFLQRCLHYKIQAKHNRRLNMKVSLSGTINDGLQPESLFPMYIILARRVPNSAVAEYSAVYRFKRAHLLTSSLGEDGSRAHANFLLPEISKDEIKKDKTKSESLEILLVSFVGKTNSLHQIDLSKNNIDPAGFPLNGGGYCLWGMLPMESIYMSWKNFPILSLGQRSEIMSTVDMHSCFFTASFMDKFKCISFHIPQPSGTVTTSRQVQVITSAEEVGANERTPYNSYTYSDIPASSLSHIIRLRTGNVIFNYRYYNNKLQRTEVTEDFSCPFCLIKCGSFKGLRYHLSSSHDLFNFEFWTTEEYQAVNVSVETDIWRSEVVADGVDPKQQTFLFRSKRLRRRRRQTVVETANHVHPLVVEPDLPVAASAQPLDRVDGGNDLPNRIPDCIEFEERITSSTIVTDMSVVKAQLCVEPGCVRPAPETNLAAPSGQLQFAKTRKLSIERSEPRNRVLLQKRQFFHSHRAQPMAMEQVLSDRDSEDEVDDDVADFEDRRMLDDFVDVTKDEKHMMHLWNSLVRKQRVIADGHIPWACEAFSELHKLDLVRSPALNWCWRLFMIKLWNHGLLDARAMDKCNVIIDQCRNQEVA